MDSFLVSAEDVQSNSLIVRGDESKHLARVMRKAVGDKVWCTDGNDRMYEVEIKSIGKESVEAAILSMHQRFNELPADVTLAISILKNPARFEWLVEKCTELGVRTIIPTVCERTIAKREKHMRLEKIAIAATKQCGRSYVPRITASMPFGDVLALVKNYDARFIAHEQADQTARVRGSMAAMSQVRSVIAFVGPEGGFTEGEIEAALAANVTLVSIGSRRLRAETAGMAIAGEIALSVEDRKA